MSQNFFAALDDSGDEAPPPVKSNAKKREPKAGNKPAAKTVVEPSKPDNRRKPNNHDRNTKFGRGGRGPPRDGKRQYDRRSGTGRGKEIKKGGGGARNWGSEKDEAKQREGKVEEGKEETAEERPEGEGEEPVVDEATEAPAPEPEDKTMTFEEYMASKGQKEEVALREVENEFKGKAASKKVEEDFLVMGGGKQKKTKKKGPDTKKSVEVGFRVAPSDSGDGGRGGRGGRGRGDRGGRGGRGGGRDGRGRGRGGRGRGPKSSIPNVQDKEAFPSL